MAFIPLFLSGRNAIIAFIALTALSVAAGNISVPAGSSLFGDVVPVSIRGRFMGLQMMTANLVKVGAIPLAGLMIAAIGGLPGYQAAFVATALIGFAATACYARIPEPRGAEGRAAQGRNVDFGGGLRRMLQDRDFVLFCLINFIWNLGVQISGPFFTVHMVQDLEFGVDTISLLATTTTIVNVAAVRLAGNLIDRHGPARMTALGMLLVPLMPLAWSLAYTPLTVGIVRAYGVIAWAGVQVAAMPLMLRITPPEYRSQFIALFNTVNGLAAIIGPIPGGYLYTHHGFNAVLYVSAAVRGLGALLFLILFIRSFHRVDAAPEGERAAA
jgi:predicted MFS family arabinose efflux permease